MNAPVPSDAASVIAGFTGIRFFGERKAYFRLLARGAVLLMVTLGIYRFWLVTDVRRFLWSNTEVADDGLEYSGTAFEILIGFLAAIAILIPAYTIFFIAALHFGLLGELSGLIAFAVLLLAGQYAVYRARRYRLSRTIFRGLRFHQEGSAWGYAVRALAWWALTVLTLGLAYPFQLASLERYKLRNTFYGDLPGRFAGAGWRLFLRGLPMWVLVAGPILLAIGAFIEVVDWDALAAAIEAEGGDVMGRVEGSNPALGAVITFAMLMGGTTGGMAALLYPAFQSMVLRWWTSGLRFGEIALTSRLRIRHVYGAYMRFLGWAMLFGIVMVVLAIPMLAIIGALVDGDNTGEAAEIAAAAILLVGYVIAALGFSTIYRATIHFSLWQLGMESLTLSGLTALDTVKASGRASSPLGEGLADALHVGGY